MEKALAAKNAEVADARRRCEAAAARLQERWHMPSVIASRPLLASCIHATNIARLRLRHGTCRDREGTEGEGG